MAVPTYDPNPLINEELLGSSKENFYWRSSLGKSGKSARSDAVAPLGSGKSDHRINTRDALGYRCWQFLEDNSQPPRKRATFVVGAAKSLLLLRLIRRASQPDGQVAEIAGPPLVCGQRIGSLNDDMPELQITYVLLNEVPGLDLSAAENGPNEAKEDDSTKNNGSRGCDPPYATDTPDIRGWS